jgi:hypothetical protein
MKKFKVEGVEVGVGVLAYTGEAVVLKLTVLVVTVGVKLI